ncbi:MAG: 8-oxo-dGTP diphosphatase [Mucilaginibacter sp.]|jgi:ADP-ribose pyrophosphatase YjhB (NUDIX family)|nr:8-oxo-dGTP diphosphatase [Mucilaginibacter sp.]
MSRSSAPAATLGAPGPLPPVVGVGAILLRRDGRFLIGRRIKPGEPESWCLPGGHVEAGETFEQAAVREIAEESGLERVSRATVFAAVLRTGADRTHLTAGVVALADPEESPGTPEPEVFDRWVWADPASPPRPLFPASAALLTAWQGGQPGEGWTAYRAGSARTAAEEGR